MLRIVRLMFTLLLLGIAVFVGAEEPALPVMPDRQPVNTAPAAGDAEHAQLMAILTAIKSDDAATLKTTEEKIAGGFPAELLRTVLAEHTAALAQAEQGAAHAEEAPTLRRQVSVLDAAIIRQTWKLDPNQLIHDYVAKRPNYTAGHIERVTDARVARAFPNFLFYSVKTFEVIIADRPQNVIKESLNLFIIGKDGSVQHLGNSSELKAIFIVNWKPAAAATVLQPPIILLPDKVADHAVDIVDIQREPVKPYADKVEQPAPVDQRLLPTSETTTGDPQRDLIYSWLRLTTIFSPGIAFTINERDLRVEMMMTATIGALPHTVLTGKAVPQGTTFRGDISVSIALDEKTGLVRDIIETRNLLTPQPAGRPDTATPPSGISDSANSHQRSK